MIHISRYTLHKFVSAMNVGFCGLHGLSGSVLNNFCYCVKNLMFEL